MKTIPINAQANADYETLKDTLEQQGYCLIRNEQPFAKAALLAIAQAFGAVQHATIQAIAPQANPVFIAHTCDEIPPHNECAYLSRPPRYLLLHCQANAAAGGAFYLVDGCEIVSHLPTEYVALLQGQSFICNMSGENVIVSLVRSLPNGKLALQYTCIGHHDDWQGHQHYYLHQAQPYSEYLIPLLQDYLRQTAYRHYHHWQAGDLMLIDNWRYLHGRNAFTGMERHLDHIRIAA